MSEMPNSAGHRVVGPAGLGRTVSRVGGLPRLLFPYLPTAAAVGCALLAVAVIAATGTAWYGNTVPSAGVAFAVFLAVVLTGFTVASAALPRVTYTWLQRNDWLPHSEGDMVFLPPAGWCVVGAHAPLAAFVITNQSLAAGHVRYTGMAAVGFVGAVLWTVHEALRAKKIHDSSDPRQGR